MSDNLSLSFTPSCSLMAQLNSGPDLVDNQQHIVDNIDNIGVGEGHVHKAESKLPS